MSAYLPTLFGENLMDVFEDFDRDFFRGMRMPEHVLYGKNAPHMMKTDVRETDTGYEIEMDLPGLKKDEISIELRNGTLTVSTRKSLEKKDEEKSGKLLRQERYSGSMSRSFYVGEHITEEDVKARFEDGVLHLTLPKKDAKKAEEKKTILIEG
ncbi:MAG: Hsp20/alpha crystallin family protein [Clostridia bacterium]|nr:Hsp20/alpha crystallin family protein [Clostridia bacterium]